MADDKRALPPHEAVDIPIYHTVVRILRIIAILSISGAIVLAGVGKAIPESVVALGAASVGALAGLLAPSPDTK